MFTIRVKKIVVAAIIGCNDDERRRRQNIEISYKIKVLDGERERLEESVDYDLLTQKIIDRVEKTDFKLLESLVDFVLDLIFENALVKEARAKITKPKALYMAKSASVSKKLKR